MDTRRPERHPAPGQHTVTRSAVLLEAAKRVLGSCEVTAVLGDAVVRVRDARSQEFVVKQHGSRSKHDREVHAYRHWTAALGPSAPRLIAADSAAMTIVITTLPGQPCSGDLKADVHHQAGALLRRFHDTEPARELPWFPGWLDDRIRHWTSQAKTLLSAEDATVVDSHLTALTMTGVPHGVPCHLDFQPRNWLLDESGQPRAYRLRACAHRPARPRLRAPAIPGLAIPARPARRFPRRIRAPPHRRRRRTGLAPRRARRAHGAGTRAPD